MKLRERRRSAASAARGAAADASRYLHAVAALPDAWGSRAGLARDGGGDPSTSSRCAAHLPPLVAAVAT